MRTPPVPPAASHGAPKLHLERAPSGVRPGAKPSPAFGGVGNWRLGSSVAVLTERNAPDWRLPSRPRAAAPDLGAETEQAEDKLWFEMRAHRVAGLSFRRRSQLGRYEVAFLSKSAKLIVELDADRRCESAHQEARRSAYFQKNGFTLLHFSARDVLHHTSRVLQAITAAARAPLAEGAGADR